MPSSTTTIIKDVAEEIDKGLGQLSGQDFDVMLMDSQYTHRDVEGRQG